MQLHPDSPVVSRTSSNELLYGRMTTLGLDLDAVEIGDRYTFDTLRQRCAKCDQHDGCAIDFRRDPNNPVWESYCPNAALLNALTELWWLKLLA